MSGVFEAYLNGTAAGFFPGHFSNLEDRRHAVERARPMTAEVADALAAQNARFAPSPARQRHLAELRGGAAAVVTGQQVGLFLGPLFNLYKAATAVRAARALAAETSRPVVPVFWLQTEDHDLPEIAEYNVVTSGEPLQLRLPARPDEKVSLAHRKLPEQVAGCLTTLRAELERLPHAAEHLARLTRHYRPGNGWVEAFAATLADLFGEEGLVLIDPRDRVLASLAAPIHERSLTRAGEIATALAARSEELAAAGLKVAAHVRDGAPLSFFHPEGPRGPRYRLVPAPRGFAEVGGSRVHSLDALLAALAADPLCFSTSVLLRPILQDTLLPTAAYVGGPGEIAYFGQLAPLFAIYDMSMPLLLPRARLRLIDDTTRRLLTSTRLAPADLDRPEEDLLASTRANDPDLPAPDEVSQRLLASFDAALGDVRARIEGTGSGLAAAFEKTRATVESAVARLAAKFESALQYRDRQLVERIRRLKVLLRPGGFPQERFYGPASFAARYGERDLMKKIVEACEPFEPAIRDVMLGGTAQAADDPTSDEASVE